MMLLVHWLKRVLLGAAMLYPLGYVLLACNRMVYPYELEWMEGASVDHMRKILAGEILYTAPSIDFIPYMYTPLYFYISALFALFLEGGFFPLRLVSFAGSLGCLFLIFQFVHRESDSMFCAVLSACLFAATYRISGAWFDLARVDSLFLFFLLLSVYLLRFQRGTLSLVAAGACAVMAYMSKQTALPIALPMVIYSLLALQGWRKRVFTLTALVITGLVVTVWDQWSDGWYLFHTWHLPRQLSHIRQGHHLADFWWRDILRQVPVAFGLSLFYLIHIFRSTRYRLFAFYFFFFSGMLGASWFVRIYFAGYDNVLFPLYAAVSICSGLGLHILLQDLAADEYRRRYLPLALLLCIVQFSALAYNPLRQLPSKADEEAGHIFLNLLHDIEGEVFVPSHAYLPVLAGKKSHAHLITIRDILQSTDAQAVDDLNEELTRAILGRKFAAIVLDHTWLVEIVKEGYNYKGPIFTEDDVFWPVTGHRTRPMLLYLRK